MISYIDIYYWGRVLVIIIHGHHERTRGGGTAIVVERSRSWVAGARAGTSGDERGEWDHERGRRGRDDVCQIVIIYF